METELKFYLFPIWGIFLLIYSSFINKESYDKKQKSFQITFLSFLFLFFALISSAFSHHIPLTLEKYLFYIYAISLFLFFLKIDRKLLKIEIFIDYLLLLSLILNVLVIFLTIFSNSRNLFQGMNLLIRSYGHNHYVAFLILVIPLIWWRLLKNPSSIFFSKKIGLFLNSILLISSYLLVLISLSRWGLLIVVVQFISIFLLSKNIFYALRKNQFIYSLFKSLIFLFLSISFIFIFLSLPFFNNDNNCSLRFYRKDLCISLTENSRFFYWRQAYLSFKNYPLFGYGLNTFKHVARRFPIINEQHSTYAHNIFLHNFAEMGVLGGGTFIILIVYIFYQSALSIKKSKKNINNFLYIGAISSLINAMLDFDWHFFVVFLLTLIFLAFILSDQSRKKNQKQNDQSWKYFIFFLSFVSIILSIGSVMTVIWQKSKTKYWLKYTPFYSIAVKAPYDESVNTVGNYKTLYSLYRYDTNFILRFLNLEEEFDKNLKKQLYLDLAEIDPAGFAVIINFEDWEIEEAKILLDKLIQVIESYRLFDGGYFINYWRRKDLAQQVFTLAQQAYEQGDWSNASYFYQNAHFFDPYVFFSKRALFLDEDDLDNFVAFSLNFQRLSPHEIGDFDRYMYLYREQINKLFLENRLDEFKQLIFYILDQEIEAKWYLVEHLYEMAENDKQESVLIEIEKRYTF